MNEFWHMIRACIAFLGGWIGYFLGGNDGLLYALVVFIVLDYATGVMRSIIDKSLSSEVGFKGICKKVLILMLVGMGNVLDQNILGKGAVLRTAIIFFFAANEGLSIIENAAYIGLPIPESLKDVLKQLHERGNNGKHENHGLT